nr:transposase [Bacteroidota bacterium]
MENKVEGIQISGKVFITDSTLMSEYGVSEQYIRKMCCKNGNWESFKKEGKRFIDYSTISLRFKIKHEMPADTNTLIGLINEDEYKELHDADAELLLLIRKELHEAFTNRYATHMTTYDKYYPGDRGKDKCRLCAKKHAVLQCIDELTCKSSALVCKKKDVLRAYLEWKDAENTMLGLFTDKTTMARKMKQFKNNPIKTLVHGNLNNKYEKSNRKLNDFSKWKIEQWYSRPEAFSARIIHEMVMAEIEKVNELRNENKKPLIPGISHSYVKYYLGIPELRNTTKRYRNTRQHNKDFTTFLRRHKPDFAGDIYMGDGTASQIPFVDENGRLRRANLFVFRDVMSGKITGFDIARNEDRYNLIDALHLAVKCEGIAPFEIVLDNASSTKTEEFKSIKTELEKIGVNVRFASVGNAKDKAQVERWNRHFQDNFERFIPGFVGGGVQSKLDRDRIDEEFLKDAAKQGKLLSEGQMIKTIAELIANFNETPDSKGMSPNERFKNSEKPNAFKLEPHQTAMMFWKNTTVKICSQEIKIEVRKHKYTYDFSFHSETLKYNGTKVRVYYDEADFSGIHVFDDNGKYLGEINEKIRVNVAKAGRDERAEKEIMKHHQHKEKTNRLIDKQIAEKGRKAQAYVDDDVDVYDSINAIAGKTKIKDAESKILLDRFFDQKGIDAASIPNPETVTCNTPYTNRNYGRKMELTNENVINKKATLLLVDQTEGERDDI